ncbi:MAG: mechanosensitive ion channel family protein [Gammaproteobacteria bacterium]|nr:mechanosensitive ion channel family protein [Gammaproteobacteria bacterium]MCW8923983.1 mechanosensitive ion channel family protein [Gammaproteobacteria bacterium]
MNDIVTPILEQSALWMPKIIGVLIVITIFTVLSNISKKIILKISSRLKLESSLSHLFARSSRVALIIIGMITALGTIGIDVSALVAGLGLTGFAFGFALKDTISNILSGVLILLYKPFKIGDRINIAGHQGQVLSIDLRYTKLVTEDSNVLIPNSKLFTDPVTVFHKN